MANGVAGAGGCLFPKVGEDGRLDTTPAAGADPCDTTNGGKAGNGGTGYSGAGNGVSISVTGNNFAFGGYAGGGVGRIRVNTMTGGFNRSSGLFSPIPITGAIAIR